MLNLHTIIKIQKKVTDERTNTRTEWQGHYLSCSSQLKIPWTHYICLQLLRKIYKENPWSRSIKLFKLLFLSSISTTHCTLDKQTGLMHPKPNFWYGAFKSAAGLLKTAAVLHKSNQKWIPGQILTHFDVNNNFQA